MSEGFMAFQEMMRRRLYFLQEVDVYILKSLYDESLNLERKKYKDKVFSATKSLYEAIDQQKETNTEISSEEIPFPVPKVSKSFEQLIREFPSKIESEKLKKRLEKMIEEGVVRNEEGFYKLSPIGQDIVDWYGQIKEYFSEKGRPSNMAKSDYAKLMKILAIL